MGLLEQITEGQVTGTQASDGRIPFRVRIGVTGHRDPVDVDGVTAEVRERLEEVSARFPDSGSTRTTFVVVSALAEGGDRIVAEQALDILRDRGAELVAVLPMAAEEYQKDFPGSLSQFTDLLRGPTTTVELSGARDRDEAYELAGRYVVDHCDVLLALWDGRPPQGRGGSAEIVSYARRQQTPILFVPTRRVQDADRAPERPEWAEVPWSPAGSTLECRERIDQFNRGQGDPRVRDQIDRKQDRIGAPAEGSRIHWQYEVVAGWAVPRIVGSDILALRYQRLYYALGGALYALAALAVALIAAQSQWGWSPHVAVLEVLCMLVLLSLYALARHIRVHELWIGYRSLAEAFRSALFIVLSGVRRKGESDRDPLCATDEPWFQRAFTEAWTGRPRGELSPDAAGDLRQFLVEAWLEDQIHYHRAAAARFHRGHERLTRAVIVLFGATVVTGCLHAFEVVPGSSASKWFTFLAIALPGCGAALVGIRDQRQYRVHEDRSTRTASRLERLRREMEGQSTLGSVQDLAARIQTLIEAENLDWSGVIEFQDLEMVL